MGGIPAPALRALLALVPLLASCGGDGTTPESFEVRGCARDELRLLAFDEADACGVEDPRQSEPGDVLSDPVADETWSRPSETDPPQLVVPLDAAISVVAHCVDDGGIVREWGCDDDADGVLSLELEPVCLVADCPGCEACPPGSRAWQGGEGQTCVAECPPCDVDHDGHAAEACGGDDCDDLDAGIHPGAPDGMDLDGEWTVERPFGLVGDDVSLVLDPDGVVVVSVHVTGQQPAGGVNVARRIDGGWLVEVADPTPDRGLHTTLAVDADGSAHVAYYSVPAAADPRLWYVSDKSGSWVPEPVGPAAVDPQISRASIGIDAGGVRVAYHDAGPRDLRFSTRTGPGQWQSLTIDAAEDSGGHASLVLDGELVHVAYVRSVGGDLDLYHVVRPPREDAFEPPELVDGAGAAGEFVTIRASAGGDLHLAYRERSQMDLRSAFRPAADPVPFETHPIEGPGDRGLFASMALDAEGRSHVSHYDRSSNELRYTMFDGADLLASEVVPFTGDPLDIVSSAIAVGPDGTVHAIWGGRTGSPIYGRRTSGSAIDQDCSGADGH